MSNDIQIFSNSQFGELRTMQDSNGETWFVGVDVCKMLGLNQPSRAIAKLDADDRTISKVTDKLNRKQDTNLINESGLYSLVLVSRKPEAKAFKRWVTHEVLPAIRRTGGYIAAREDETPEEIMARALIVAQDTIERKDALIAELKPKALFADAVGASDGTCLVGELAKMMRQNGIEIGQNRLFEWMRDNGYLGKKDSNRNVPTQKAMDAGLFRIKETAITHSDGHVTINRTPKVTGKGQRYFMAKFLGAA